MSYERLLALVSDPSEFTEKVHSGYWAIRRGLGSSPANVLRVTADYLCGKYDLSGEIADGSIVLWSSSSRAKQPACIIVSADMGQPASPSATMYRRTGMAFIQVFEVDADDTEVADGRTLAAHWFQAQDRVLFH